MRDHPGTDRDPGILEVRRDGTGRPELSVTFLLSRTPAPHESIGDLVLTATLSVGLVARLDDLVWTGVSLEVADRVRTQSHGPFGSVALATTLGGEEARRLLTALAAGHGGPTMELQARRADGATRYWLLDLAEVLAPTLAADPSAYVHLVTVDGGAVRQVATPRAATRTRGPADPGPLVLRQQVITPIAQAVRPERVTVPDLLLGGHLAVKDHLLGIHLTPGTSGPVLSPDPLLGDRDGTSRWYVPEVTLVRPAGGADPATSPFRFDLTTSGHLPDGTPGLEATVTVTLAAGPSAATVAAWQQAGEPPMSPLPSGAHVGLRIPFRDAEGRAQVETVPATSTVVTGTFGERGSTVRATFDLANGWARMAYGALSTPGFQTTAPTLQVTLDHAGWQSQGVALSPAFLASIVTDKVVALRQRGDVSRPLAKTHLTGLAKAGVHVSPVLSKANLPVELRPGAVSWSWVGRTSSVEVDVVVPCAEHGQLYRQARDGGWDAIGCRPALQLGQAEYRTWQAEDVTSVTGVRVFRSLTQPGRFLVVPERYGVGRHPADDPTRALRPTLMLTSTIDVDDPANILCVLAAALEPTTNAAELALLAAELRTRTGRDVTLLTPAQAGLVPEVVWAVPGVRSLDSVPVDTGFTVVVTTGVPAFLALKTLLTTGSVVGSARYRLPGGIELASTLRLDLGNVVGPLEGPVAVTRTGDEVALTNPLSHRVAVHRVVAAGTVVASPEVVLPPGGDATVALPPGTPGPVVVDHDVEPGAESLDETRSYIEDLRLGLTFIATGDLTGLAGLEIASEFLGHTHEPFTLTAAQRSRERDFVLPLTAYATDPALTYTVTAVGTDGTRTGAPAVTWPVRSRGVLLPIDNPTHAS